MEEGGGEWVSYLFTHPQTGEDAPKHSWVVRRGNLISERAGTKGSNSLRQSYDSNRSGRRCWSKADDVDYRRSV